MVCSKAYAAAPFILLAPILMRTSLFDLIRTAEMIQVQLTCCHDVLLACVQYFTLSVVQYL